MDQRTRPGPTHWIVSGNPRPFGIYNGESNNRQQNHWDLQTARDELGYAPQDDVADVVDAATLRDQVYVEPQAGVLRSTP